MRTSITAVVVAQTGKWLEATLAALSSQTVQADRIIGVVNGNDEKITAQFQAAQVTQVISTGTKTSFGKAVGTAERIFPLAADLPEFAEDPAFLALQQTNIGSADAESASGDTESVSAAPMRVEVDEWLWLLTEDSAPEPKALRALLSSVLRAPSVAIAGPKLIDWEQPERIVELGQGLTQYGSRWLLRRQELDQQQYDHLQDTLGVGPTGMLVRRTVFRDLGGFNPALTTYDDGLDLSVRARLAGHRVVVAPRARVRVAMTGVAGPRLSRSKSVMRSNHHRARTAHLHRRISYAPGLAAFFMWLLLPLLGLFRMGWALLREQPGNMFGELFAALRVFFQPAAIIRARQAIRKNNFAGWGAIRPLRTDSKAVRTARLIDKEAILAAQGRDRKELHFISSGGLAVLFTSVLAAIALCWWLYGQNSVSGGGSAPLSSFFQLWENTKISEGLPADPFTWVLALIGSLTFFNTSLAVVLFLGASIPLATLGGWLWGAQFTESAAGRALAGFAWALSPVVLGSIDHARFQTVVLAVLLPWLLIAATRAHESWAWAGTASLLAAAGLAAAPVLLPFALIMWLLGIILHPRSITKILATAIAPAALFFPSVIHATATGNLLGLLRDPGITNPYQPANLWQLLLGFPEFGLEGWARWLSNIGLDVAPTTLLVGFLLAPLALLALLGMFTGKVPVTIFSGLLGAGGMAVAIFSANTSLTTAGTASVPLWTGSGLALYWLAIITLATSGSTILKKAAGPVVTITLVACTVAVAPLLTSMVTGQSEARNSANPMPSIVTAAGTENPNLQTLQLTVLDHNVVRTQVITGSGLSLDEIRTAEFSEAATAQDERIAAVVAALLSPGSSNIASEMANAGISYVLLASGGEQSARANVQAIIDEQGALENAGQTSAGHVWRASAVDQEAIANAQEKLAAERADTAQDTYFDLANLSFTANTVWLVQAITLLGMFLLALPTGEVAEQPIRRKRNKHGTQQPVTDTTAAGILQQQTGTAAKPTAPAQQHSQSLPAPSNDADSAENNPANAAEAVDPEQIASQEGEKPHA